MKKINKLKIVIVLLIFILIILAVVKGVTKINVNNDMQVAEQKNVINNNELGQENIFSNNTQSEIGDNNLNDIQNNNLLQNTNSVNEENINEIENISDFNEINNSSGETNDTMPNNKDDKDNSENSQNEDSSNSSNNIEFDSSVAFIGDSRTQGFIMYNGLKDVQDYSYVGLMVDTAITKKFVKTSNGEKITLLQDMKNKNVKFVYIMLGLNELGWSYPQVFKLKYNELIDEIRKVQPDCKIYVQSIIPVTKSKNQSDKIFNNKNVEKFNKLIQEVANEKNVKYLDVGSALIDDDGYLPEEASTDGIHISPKYCKKWLEYLKSNS